MSGLYSDWKDLSFAVIRLDTLLSITLILHDFVLQD